MTAAGSLLIRQARIVPVPGLILGTTRGSSVSQGPVDILVIKGVVTQIDVPWLMLGGVVRHPCLSRVALKRSRLRGNG
jgi:hypothetical protein